jgi:uncharacterized membrane protein YciS (DUF1049 family)
MDNVKEQIVKKKPNAIDTLKKAGIIIAVIVIFLVASAIPAIAPFAVILAAAAAFGAYYLITMLNVEYEYTFINGDLDIDAIYNKSRRKRVFSGTVRDFEVMAHVEDTAHARDFGNAEVKNYFSGVVGKDTYAFLAAHKGKRLKVIIEPNEKMLKAFSTVLTPRKLFKKL